MHRQLDVHGVVELSLRVPAPRRRGHAGPPYHLHHAVVVVVVLRADTRQDGVDVLEPIAGQVAPKVDDLDEPRRRCRFDADDGGFRIQVRDEHGGESQRRPDIDE